MKFCVYYKESGEKKFFKSISEIARNLGVSYAVAYKSFLYSVNPELRKGIKIAQRTFDSKFEIRIADD